MEIESPGWRTAFPTFKRPVSGDGRVWMTREFRAASPVVIKSSSEKRNTSCTVPFLEKAVTFALSAFSEDKRAPAGSDRETVMTRSVRRIKIRRFKKIPPCLSDEHSFANGGSNMQGYKKQAKQKNSAVGFTTAEFLKM